SQSRQPLDKPFLPDMPLTDRAQSASEVLHRAAFLGDDLEIDKKARRLVIAARVAAFDFGLDLAPDAVTPVRDRVEPRPTGFLRFLSLPLPFCGCLVGLCTLIGETDRPGAGAQFAGGACGSWW